MADDFPINSSGSNSNLEENSTSGESESANIINVRIQTNHGKDTVEVRKFTNTKKLKELIT